MKRCVQCFLSFCFFFAVALATNKARFHYDWESAFWRTLLTPIVGTIWPEGFSDAAFVKIQVGMPEARVEALVGKPIQKSCDEDGCSWSYADQDPDSAPYDRRWVFFDRRQQVTSVRHEFYID